jgi:hypothetical protein
MSIQAGRILRRWYRTKQITVRRVEQVTGRV